MRLFLLLPAEAAAAVWERVTLLIEDGVSIDFARSMSESEREEELIVLSGEGRRKERSFLKKRGGSSYKGKK